jgi:hypothetical protein
MLFTNMVDIKTRGRLGDSSLKRSCCVVQSADYETVSFAEWLVTPCAGLSSCRPAGNGDSVFGGGGYNLARLYSPFVHPIVSFR